MARRRNSSKSRPNNMFVVVWEKSKIELMSLDDMLARIRRRMKDCNYEFKLKSEMKMLEDVLSVNVDLQKKNEARHLMENDELQNLRAELQKKYSTFLGFGEKMNWESLTEDIQIEILSRLPVKSLMRFKCVQQSWNILFKTSSFMNKRMLHNSKNGCDVNEPINLRRYPKRRCWAKSKKLVAKMSHDAVIAEIQSGMKKANCANDLKIEMRFLEDVLTCKASLRKEIAAKYQKNGAKIQKVIAALQKRIAKV